MALRSSTKVGTPANGSRPATVQEQVPPETDKSLESWIWDAACSIRGANDAPKYKEFILPLIFAKRLCDVFDDELNRIAKEVGSRAKAFKLVKHDKKPVRFYLPLEPKNPDDTVWSVIRGDVTPCDSGNDCAFRERKLLFPIRFDRCVIAQNGTNIVEISFLVGHGRSQATIQLD
jgi:hypothetical protein